MAEEKQIKGFYLELAELLEKYDASIEIDAPYAEGLELTFCLGIEEYSSGESWTDSISPSKLNEFANKVK
jgi:hypothetical protein